jgi:S1-C subfamily serine protease
MLRRWKPATRIAVAVPFALGVVVAAGFAASVPKSHTLGHDVRAQSAFRDARDYTVRVRTSIATPFVEDERGSSEGAGFLIDRERGWILTNAHVAGRSPSDVEVAFHGGEFAPARKIYVDTFTDVAVIAVDRVPEGRRAAVIDPSGEVEIGQPVGVFGHPLGMHFTGTRGIVSNISDRAGPDLIQIDATVNPGNSGGPVIAFDTGEVVGIATSGVMGDKSDRLNFATPMKDVSRMLALLRQSVTPSAPRLEFSLLRNEYGSTTMEVGRSFDPARWPFAPGDRIVEVDGAGPVATQTDLVSALRGRDGKSRVRVERGGRHAWVDVTPEATTPIVERRGIMLCGAIVAPFAFDDHDLAFALTGVAIHSVEPGSEAERVGITEGDTIETIDGRPLVDLEAIEAHLRGRTEDGPVRLVLRRFNTTSSSRCFDFEVRELSSASFESIPAPAAVAASR